MRRALLVATLLVATSVRADDPLAPAFTIQTLSGDTFSLEDARTEGAVLIDFWATWCKPCVRALPEIQALHERYVGRGLSVIGVSVDGPRNYAKVRPFANRFGLSYPIAVDTKGDLARRFRVNSVPSVVVVDSTGVIRFAKTGYRPGDELELERAVRGALGLPPHEAGG